MSEPTTAYHKPANFYKGGFMNGLNQLRVCDVKQAQKELFSALKIKDTNRMTFSMYKKGANDLKISQIEAVEKVFHKYGITENIWGSI